MIETEAQATQAREVVESLERAVLSLKTKVAAKNPALFSSMAADYFENIRRIRHELDTYTGVELVASAGAPVWLGLEGTGIELSNLSSKLLADWLGRFRKSVQGVADYIEEGVARAAGRPKGPIQSMTDFRVRGLLPGSVRIGLELPASTQEEIFPLVAESGSTAAEIALDKVLKMAAWAASTNSVADAREFAADDEELRAIATEVLRIIPSPRGAVTRVKFEGMQLPQGRPVRLTSGLRSRVAAIAEGELEERLEEHEGVLREIDLDAQKGTLRQRAGNLSNLVCRFSDELMSQATSNLNKRVVVAGLVSSRKPLLMHVQSIVLAQDPKTLREESETRHA